MFRFEHIDYFFLLAFVPVFALVFTALMIWRKRALLRFGELSVISRLLPEIAPAKLILKFILLMVAWGLLVFALAGPQTGSKMETVQRKGIDLVIALDVSNSMLAQDIKPNRMERAKQSINRLIDRLQGDRIGIVVFAGKAYTQLPITTDYAAAKLFVSTINPGMIPSQGTAIADALDLSIKSFGDSKNNKAIVIISDGEDHEGSVLEQAELAASKGIVIYAIGMGLPEGAPIPVYEGDKLIGFKKDKEGNAIVSKLDETLLQQVSGVGKGMYVRATNSSTGLDRIFDDINEIQKSEIESKQFADYENQFQYFLALALIFLILDLFIFERKTAWMKSVIREKGYPSPAYSGKPPAENTLRRDGVMKTFFTILIGFFCVVSVQAQKENRYLREGNRSFREGDFQAAEKDYRKALELNRESVTGQFNLGTAVYKEKNYEESANIYGGLSEKIVDKPVKAGAFHNLGNALLEAQQYEKSIEAYKNALINNPNDLDSKYNLEYARMKLQQQQQQQQQQDQNKDQKEQDKQKKDDQKDQKDQDQQKKQDQQQKQDQQKQPPKPDKMSKEDAERMLEAMKSDEKKTMEKVNKQKAKVGIIAIEKDW